MYYVMPASVPTYHNVYIPTLGPTLIQFVSFVYYTKCNICSHSSQARLQSCSPTGAEQSLAGVCWWQLCRCSMPGQIL